MKIKLAILERDKGYLTRIVSAFSTKYADKLEVYSFSDADIAVQTLNESKIDVFLAGDTYEIDTDALPHRCAFAYLVDSLGIESVNGQRAICKFQKADLIYKQILSVFSEKSGSIAGYQMGSDQGTVIIFCAPSGGVGCSSVAAACAAHFAGAGKKVLYLNYEKFGSSDLFFAGQGQFDMSDIVFALKSKKTNLPIKLESSVKQDISGVHFYSQPKIALDMMELNAEDKIRLITEAKLTGGFEYIIVDMDFGLDEETLKILRQAQKVIWIGDGSESSNGKTERAYTALATMEQNADMPIVSRLAFLYNRVSNSSGHTLQVNGLKVLGNLPKYSGADTRKIMKLLATAKIFDTIL